MTEQITLEIQPRTGRGTNESRRLRRIEGMIPGVLYGAKGKSESVMIAATEFNKALQEDSVFSQVLNITFGKEKVPAVVRELQRHPANDCVLHFDLLRISEDHEIDVSVPIRLVNEDNCVGVKLGGGSIARSITELAIRCLPRDLPEFIEVDLADVQTGQTIHMSELRLPEGVVLAQAHLEHDSPVVSVTTRRGGLVEGDEAETIEEQTELPDTAED